MLAVHKGDVSQNSLFHEGKRDSAGNTFLGEKEMKQDKNFNVVDDTYDRNQNQPKSRGEEKSVVQESTSGSDDNLVLLTQRQRAKRRLKDISQAMRSEGIGLSSEEEVCSPPEGAEIKIAEEEVTDEDTVRVCEDWAGSPMEDNGYASSSLSIDSPDSITGNAWDLPAATPTKPDTLAKDPEPVDADAETSSDSDAFSPTLAETLQNLQDKEQLKRQEKEKHQVHLTMYRRLALLRWIRGLQQKVVDQQNRLQDSFDTILDNRKELLRYIQHGVSCPSEATKEDQ